MLDELSSGVDIVENGISVLLVTCREDGHLVMLVRSFEHLFAVGSDVEASFQHFARWSSDVEEDVRSALRTRLANTVSECFIEIENDQFLETRFLELKLNGARIDIFV